MTKLKKVCEAILNISKEEIEKTKGSIVPVRLENGTTLNDKKWRNMSAWAGCKREEVAVYIDDTLLASCKKGGAFTEEAFWHTDLLTRIPKKAEKRFAPLRYADVRGVKWKEERSSYLTVVFDDGEIEVYGSIYAKFYAAALEKAVTAAGYELGTKKPAKKTASKKKAAEPEKPELSPLEYLDTLNLGTASPSEIVAKIAKDEQARRNAERAAAAEAQAVPEEQGYTDRIAALERELAELRTKAAEEAAAKKAAEEAAAKKAAEEETKRKAATRTASTVEDEALLQQIYKTKDIARRSQPEVVEIIKQVSMEGRTAASRGDYALAKRKFKLTAQLGVKQDVFNMAYVCYKVGDLDEAAVWADRAVKGGYEKAVKLKEDIEKARMDQWLEQAEAGKMPKEEFFKRLMAAKVTFIYPQERLEALRNVLFDEAFDALENADYNLAIPKFEALYICGGNSAESLAYIYFVLGDQKKSETWLAKAPEEGRLGFDYFRRMQAIRKAQKVSGDLYAKKMSYLEALKILYPYKDIAELEPLVKRVYTDVMKEALEAAKKGEWKKAIQYMETAFQYMETAFQYHIFSIGDFDRTKWARMISAAYKELSNDKKAEEWEAISLQTWSEEWEEVNKILNED